MEIMAMRKQSIVVVKLALSIWVFAVCGQAQSSTKDPVKAKLDSEKPGVFLSFDRFGKRIPVRDDEKGDGVWLKLQNNMRVSIRTCTFGVSAQGDPLLVSAGGLQIGLKYEVEVVNSYLFNPVNRKVPVGYSFGSSCEYIDIKPGAFLNFSVPIEHLVQGLAIKIRFEYGWEKIGEANPQHFVFFRYSSIPSTPQAS